METTQTSPSAAKETSERTILSHYEKLVAAREKWGEETDLIGPAAVHEHRMNVALEYYFNNFVQVVENVGA